MRQKYKTMMNEVVQNINTTNPTDTSNNNSDNRNKEIIIMNIYKVLKKSEPIKWQMRQLILIKMRIIL